MNSTRKTLSGVVVGATLAAAAVAVPMTSAQASTACSASSIRINATPGAENPSTVSGHSHVTGKHYVRSITNRIWYWNADNDNGRTDQWDTYHGMQQC